MKCYWFLKHYTIMMSWLVHKSLDFHLRSDLNIKCSTGSHYLPFLCLFWTYYIVWFSSISMTLNMPKYLYLIFTSIKHLDLSDFLDISISFFHSKHIKICSQSVLRSPDTHKDSPNWIGKRRGKEEIELFWGRKQRVKSGRE